MKLVRPVVIRHELSALFLFLLMPKTIGAENMISPKTDCETLMQSARTFAEQMLRSHQGFVPFGEVLTANDEIVSMPAHDGREHPPSSEVISLLKYGFIQGAKSGKYKATALVYDSKIKDSSTGDNTDAIIISLNHRDSYSITVILPYHFENEQLVVGKLLAQKGEADIFASQSK
jgi:hypothetical protein